MSLRTNSIINEVKRRIYMNMHIVGEEEFTTNLHIQEYLLAKQNLDCLEHKKVH